MFGPFDRFCLKWWSVVDLLHILICIYWDSLILFFFFVDLFAIEQLSKIPWRMSELLMVVTIIVICSTAWFAPTALVPSILEALIFTNSAFEVDLSLVFLFAFIWTPL